MRHFLHTGLTAFLCLILAAACTPTEREKQVLDTLKEDDPAQEVFGVDILVTNMGLPQAWLKGPHALEMKQENAVKRVFDEGVEVVLYDDEGLRKSTITAERGEFLEGMANALLTGDVIVLTSDGERLLTEKLLWNEKGDSIYSDTESRIYQQDQILFCNRFWSTTNFEEYEMDTVRGTIMLNDE